MIRLWLIFIALAVLIHLGITTWRRLEGREQWALTKSIGYRIIVSLLAVLALAVIVVLF